MICVIALPETDPIPLISGYYEGHFVEAYLPKDLQLRQPKRISSSYGMQQTA